MLPSAPGTPRFGGSGVTFIRVNPPELRVASEQLRAMAGTMRDLGGRVMDSAERAPSYDGQFGPKVRALAAEAQARFSQQANRLEDHADELDQVAGRFEAAEQESIQGFAFLEVQYRSLLERIFGSAASVQGMATVPELLRQALLDEEPPPPDPDEEDDEKSLLDRLADQFRELEFFWDVITDRHVAAWMRTVRNSPPVTLVLPMLRGLGMDEVAGPLVQTFDSSFWVRSVGRFFGDASAAPLFVIGWGITLAPAQIRNVSTGAPWNDFVADGIVDSGTYLGSEAAGWAGLLVGNFLGGPPVGVPAKFAADLGTGAVLEYYGVRYDWRGRLAGEVAQVPAGVSLWFTNAIDESLRMEIPPIPTPPELHSASQTPVPPGTPLQISTTTSLPSVSTPTPQPPRQPVTPVVTPVPQAPDG